MYANEKSFRRGSPWFEIIYQHVTYKSFRFTYEFNWAETITIYWSSSCSYVLLSNKYKITNNEVLLPQTLQEYNTSVYWDGKDAFQLLEDLMNEMENILRIG